MMEQKEIWTTRNGIVKDQFDNIVALLPTEEMDEKTLRTILFAPQARDAIRKFVDDVNRGKFTPKTAVKEFEKILAKYDE